MLRSLFDTRGHVEPCRWLARQPPCGGRQPPCEGQAPKKTLTISASADGGPRSRVCARETLRSAPHRH